MMHDCRTAQERLIDLIFKELDEAESLRLLSEVEACAECREQHRSMSLTLFAFDQATASFAPEENFWPGYHARLERRLEGASAMSRKAKLTRRSAKLARRDAKPSTEPPVWQRFMAASVRVPAPVAALALLFVAGFSLFAFTRARQHSSPVTNAPQAATVSTPTAPQTGEKTSIVEVPVIQERVVTRTVYVARNSRAPREDAATHGAEGPRFSDRKQEDEGQAIQHMPETNARNGQAAGDTHAALAGFKPAGEVKLRIIKGNYQDEK